MKKCIGLSCRNYTSKALRGEAGCSYTMDYAYHCSLPIWKRIYTELDSYSFGMVCGSD